MNWYNETDSNLFQENHAATTTITEELCSDRSRIFSSFVWYAILVVFMSLNQFMEPLVKLKIVNFSEFFLKNITSIRVFWGRMTFITLHLTEHLVAMTYIDTIFCVALIMNHIIWSIYFINIYNIISICFAEFCSQL